MRGNLITNFIIRSRQALRPIRRPNITNTKSSIGFHPQSFHADFQRRPPLLAQLTMLSFRSVARAISRALQWPRAQLVRAGGKSEAPK